MAVGVAVKVAARVAVSVKVGALVRISVGVLGAVMVTVGDLVSTVRVAVAATGMEVGNSVAVPVSVGGTVIRVADGSGVAVGKSVGCGVGDRGGGAVGA